MKVFLIVSVTIFLLSFVALVIYSILTLLQIKNTAKEAEEFLKKFNKSLENVNNISEKITSGVSLVIAISSLLTRIIKNLVFGKER